MGLTAALWAVGTYLVMILAAPDQNWAFDAVMWWSRTTGWTGSPEQLAVVDRLRWPLLGTLGVLALLLAVADASLRRGRPRAALGWLAGGMALLFPAACCGLLLLEPLRSPYDLARLVQRTAGPADAVVVQEPREMMWMGGLNYYAKRTVTLMKNPAFDSIPMRREGPERFVDDAGLAGLWQSGRGVVLVAEESIPPLPVLSRLRPLRRVGQAGEYSVWTNRTSDKGD